jgi:hypothetical protein
LHNPENQRKRGDEAGSINNRGYIKVRLKYEIYAAHHLAWYLHNHKWPNLVMDHINGVKHDNRIVNLRLVTNEQNARNRATPSTNSSGVMGVHWSKCKKKWRAQINFGKGNKHLGYFTDLERAKVVRKEAEEYYDFHRNHGRLV